MKRPRTNLELQDKYEAMHRQGSAAWFSDGAEERQEILEVGKPWDGLRVLEIGCGEGELAREMWAHNASIIVAGIDYSSEAISKAKSIDGGETVQWICGDYRGIIGFFDRIVMQGILEHLDNPWQELEWMIDNLLAPGGDIITSSPCFCNPRGVVWMTLATLFDAPVSLTDLHFLHPWEFDAFARQHNLLITTTYCDYDWGNGRAMVEDYLQRLPKVFPDMEGHRIVGLANWLNKARFAVQGVGATAVYHLRRG